MNYHIPNTYIYPIRIWVACHYCVDEGKGGHEGSGMFGGGLGLCDSS